MLRRLKREMGQYKFTSNFLTEYELLQRKRLKLYDIYIATFTGLAAIVSLINEIPSFTKWANTKFGSLLPPVIICIAFIVTVLKYLLPKIMPSEYRIMKISELQEFYTDRYNRLEKIWYKFKNGDLTEKKLTDEFYRIINGETKINRQVNDVVKSIPKGIHKKANEETIQYLKPIFKNEKVRAK
jgi:hypothetical protein